MACSLSNEWGPVRRVLDGVPRPLGLLDELPSLATGATKIRLLGDYHLGQVLWTGRASVILDFKGEPARPLAKRREQQSPLKDGVGMLRSFDHAAHAGLIAFTRDGHGDPERLAPGARAWRNGTSAAFLDAYYATARGASRSSPSNRNTGTSCRGRVVHPRQCFPRVAR